MGEAGIDKLVFQHFERSGWWAAFLADQHHGYTHGNQVREAAFVILSNLTEAEQKALKRELDDIPGETNPQAEIPVEIAALLHDCGRFSDRGELLAELQETHPHQSAARAEKLCRETKLESYWPLIEDAILGHDYQSPVLTPQMFPPATIVGKIVQSADQMCWFHPDSLKRTLSFNEDFGRPFYDEKLSLKERQSWSSSDLSPDAITVMLRQLHGPTGEDRFGISYAREKVASYREALEAGIVAIAKERGVGTEVKKLLIDYRCIS